MNATIAVLEGDGIGPEIMAEALKVLSTVAGRFGHRFDERRAPFGAAAYRAGGSSFPDDARDACDAADAILKGPVGLDVSESAAIPDDQRPERAVLELRERYTTFANYRPIRLPQSLAILSHLTSDHIADGIDILMIRELMGGIYLGEKTEGSSTDMEWANDDCRYTGDQVTRIAELAFSEARDRGVPLTLVHKDNVLATSRLWRHLTDSIAADYADVPYQTVLVDAACFYLVAEPARFNGILLMENLHGDLLSDLAGGIVGSLGLIGSVCVGPEKSYAEPAHGSAWEVAGTGVANPFSMIASVALLLDRGLGLRDEAEAIWEALFDQLEERRVTPDLAAQLGAEALSTQAFGDSVAERIAAG